MEESEISSCSSNSSEVLIKTVLLIDCSCFSKLPVKKERSFKIESGFTLGQKDAILTVCVAGLLELPPGYYNKTKVKKEKNSKKESLIEERLSETIEDTPKRKPKKKNS